MSSAPIKKFEISNSIKMFFGICALVGMATFASGFINPDLRPRIWHSYLTSMFYFISLGLGGLFFTAIQHVTKAGWSVNVRRFSESFVMFLPYSVFIILIYLIGASDTMYEWMQPDKVMADSLLLKKAAYLNKPFYLVRTVGFYILWLVLGYKIVSNSLKQDETGDKLLSAKNLKLSIAFIIVFALSYTLFSIDTIMSLAPKWYSTIFGVYCFAGLFQSTISMMIILIAWAHKRNILDGYVNENHFHDLGKLLFAFTIFYAYIAFSQFMLIWYANIPEETEFYFMRAHGSWMTVSISLLIFKFIVPFIGLLPRAVKRSPKALIPFAVLILIMQYVDIYWLVYPNFDHEQIHFGFWEIGIFIGFFGIFMWSVFHFFGMTPIIPSKDPYIEESVHHHVM